MPLAQKITTPNKFVEQSLIQGWVAIAELCDTYIYVTMQMYVSLVMYLHDNIHAVINHSFTSSHVILVCLYIILYNYSHVFVARMYKAIM